MGLAQYPELLAAILEDSAESMRGECPQESAEQRWAWWRARIKLDLRMAGLLKGLDEDLLGPWRCPPPPPPFHALVLAWITCRWRTIRDGSCWRLPLKLGLCREGLSPTPFHHPPTTTTGCSV